MTKSGQPKGAHALLRKYPDLGLLVGARFFSMAAGQIQSVAIAWHVYEKTHQQIALGYVGLSYFLPAFGLSLIAGHVADRFDRRWVLLSTVILQIVCTLSLAWIVAHPELDVLWVYGVTFLVGCARAFAGPAAQALLPSTTRLENLSGAIALSSSGAQLAMIAGPAAGGALYALTHGGPILFYIVALILVVCAILVFWIRTEARPQHHERSSFASLFDGLRYVWQRKVILGAISLDLFAVLLGGSVALLPVFARDILHVGPQGLGLMRGAPAFGAALMGVYLAHSPVHKKAGPAMFIAVFCFGLATIAFGLSRSFVFSVLMLLILGAADMISVIIRQTLIQIATPDAMRGRVSAISLVFIGASNELGEFESGVTAEWLGTVPAVILGGVGTCLVVMLWLVLFPELRQAKELHNVNDQN